MNDKTSIENKSDTRISVIDVTNGLTIRDTNSSYRGKAFPFASDNTIRFGKFDERELA